MMTKADAVVRFCCKHLSGELTSSSNEVLIIFQSNMSGISTDDRRGFQLSFSIGLSLCFSLCLSLSLSLYLCPSFTLISLSMQHARPSVLPQKIAKVPKMCRAWMAKIGLQ